MLLFNMQQCKNRAEQPKEDNMPSVTNLKTGKTRHFKYTASGVKAAKEYAKASGGKFKMGSINEKFRKKK